MTALHKHRCVHMMLLLLLSGVMAVQRTDALTLNNGTDVVTNSSIITTDDTTRTYNNDLENLSLDQVTDNNNISTNAIDEENNGAHTKSITTTGQLAEETLYTEPPENEHVMKIQSSQKANVSIDTDTTTAATKSPGLYAVKATYKRPKKLEISTPVAFTRDPNDNSWRNESISSLGIVFKASNASKPFTLIAKEKSESELIATMQKFDHDDNDAPELKERLEKLSEQRKLKKKPNAEKDQEYNDDDYEEFNYNRRTSTTTVRPRHAHIEPYQRSEEDEPTLAIQREFNHNKQEAQQQIDTTTATARQPMANIFARATTESSKMMDSREESNFPNVELNKFTTQRAPPPKQYAYDRKPTLEYFPPRQRKPERFTTVPPSMQHAWPSRTPADTNPPQQQQQQYYKLVQDDYNRNAIVEQVPYVSPGVDYDSNSATPHHAPYPVLYNNSVVHDGGGGGPSLSSSALMKKLYGQRAECDDCYNEDLAPEYELHYYVPDQEETQLYERSPQPMSAQLLPAPHRMYVRLNI